MASYQSKLPTFGAPKRPVSTFSRENLPSGLPRYGATTHGRDQPASGLPRFGAPKKLAPTYSGAQSTRGLPRSAGLELHEKDLDDNRLYTPAEGHRHLLHVKRANDRKKVEQQLFSPPRETREEKRKSEIALYRKQFPGATETDEELLELFDEDSEEELKKKGLAGKDTKAKIAEQPFYDAPLPKNRAARRQVQVMDYRRSFPESRETDAEIIEMFDQDSEEELIKKRSPGKSPKYDTSHDDDLLEDDILDEIDEYNLDDDSDDDDFAIEMAKQKKAIADIYKDIGVDEDIYLSDEDVPLPGPGEVETSKILDEVQEAALDDTLNLSRTKVQFDLNKSVPPEFAKTTPDINLIMNDEYQPGFLDDAINKNINFYDAVNTKATDTRPISLIEAFDIRVTAEKAKIEEKLNKSDDSPILKTLLDSEKMRKVSSGIDQPDMQSTFQTSPAQFRDDMIEAGITAIEINTSIRDVPQNSLLAAVDCLVKAEMMHTLEKSLSTPPERKAQTDTQQNKTAEGKKTGDESYLLDETIQTSSIPSTEYYKPLEIISYVGITKAKK